MSEEKIEENNQSYNWIDVAVSVLVVAIVVYVMMYFNGKYSLWNTI